MSPRSTTNYTVTALTDANACAARDSDLTGSALVTLREDCAPFLSIHLLSTPPTNQYILSWTWTNVLVLQSAPVLTNPALINWMNVATGMSGSNTFTYPITNLAGYFRLGPTN